MTGETLETSTVLRRNCQHSIARLEALAPLICADDNPEDLHEFRVSIRRTRSVLGSFHRDLNSAASTRLRAKLKTLASKTDALRDLDVLLEDHADLCRRIPPSLTDGCSALASHLYSARSAAHARLVEYLVSDAFGSTLQQCRSLTDKLGEHTPRQALEHTASVLTPRRIARLQRRCLKLSKHASDYELHQLRIAGKKMRYMLDLLEPALPAKKRRRALKALKQAQDNLGRFHDLCVQQELFEELLGQQNLPETVRLTMAALVANIYARRQKRRNTARKTAIAFSGAELAQLGHTLEVQAKPA